MSQRLAIDWTRCDGRGLCSELLPEVLTPDDWGYPLSRTGERRPVVPRSLRPMAEQAVLDCPRLALLLVPDDTPKSHGSRTASP